MISAIIPTLNEEKYLESTIKDLKKIKEIKEIIVVDAKSEDKTQKIAKKHKCKVLSTTKRNASVQRNLGAKAAKYHIFFFVDADMHIPKKAASSMIKKIKNNIAVVPKTTIKKPTLGYYIFVAPSNLAARILPGQFMRGGCMLIQKQAFWKIGGFNEKAPVAEDIELGARLRKQGPIAFSNIPIFESPRRYEKNGYFKTWLEWTINTLWVALFGKSFYSAWHPVR